MAMGFQEQKLGLRLTTAATDGFCPATAATSSWAGKRTALIRRQIGKSISASCFDHARNFLAIASGLVLDKLATANQHSQTVSESIDRVQILASC